MRDSSAWRRDAGSCAFRISDHIVGWKDPASPPIDVSAAFAMFKAYSRGFGRYSISDTSSGLSRTDSILTEDMVVDARCPRCGRSGCATEADCPACLRSPLPESLHSPLRVGTTFRGFEIVGWIGAGGTAVVYKARQTALDRAAAIKVLAPEYASSPKFVQRFEREARVLAALNHPNLVHLYEFGREGDLLYLAMEYVDGVTLQEWLKTRERRTIAGFLDVINGLCDGLDRIHRAGLVHRDLKPSNLLIPREGPPKISDFGLVLDTGDPSNPTLSGTLIGTPHYMSPEQALGRTVDARSDLYSLGVLLFQGLAGRLPFEGPPTVVLIRHAQEAPPALADLVP